jgi:hypothetical protein
VETTELADDGDAEGSEVAEREGGLVTSYCIETELVSVQDPSTTSALPLVVLRGLPFAISPSSTSPSTDGFRRAREGTLPFAALGSLSFESSTFS